MALAIDLRALLAGDENTAAATPDAARLASFLHDFRYRELSRDEKLDRIRAAPPWNRGLEITDPQWISSRLDEAVEVLRADAEPQIRSGVLTDSALRDLQLSEFSAILPLASRDRLARACQPITVLVSDP